MNGEVQGTSVVASPFANSEIKPANVKNQDHIKANVVLEGRRNGSTQSVQDVSQLQRVVSLPGTVQFEDEDDSLRASTSGREFLPATTRHRRRLDLVVCILPWSTPAIAPLNPSF